MVRKPVDEASKAFVDAGAWCARHEVDRGARGVYGLLESTVLFQTGLGDAQGEERAVAGIVVGECVEAVAEHRFGAPRVAGDDAAWHFGAERGLIHPIEPGWVVFGVTAFPE
jgi:hypothetical protein